MPENNVKLTTNERLFKIDDMPTAMIIYDVKTFKVISCNKQFLELFSLDHNTDLQSISIEEISKLESAKSIITLEISGVSNHLLVSLKPIEIDEEKFLICAFEKLMELFWSDDEALAREVLKEENINNNSQIIIVNKDAEYMINGIYNRKGGLKLLSEHMGLAAGNANFSLVYFMLNVENDCSENPQEGYDNAVAIVKNCIRQTDIFVKMIKNEYMLIFPNCAYEVVESIMGTVEKKIDLFNQTEDTGYTIYINCAIEENNPSNKYSPEQFINKLRKTLKDTQNSDL